MIKAEIMNSRRKYYTFLQRLFYKEVDSKLLAVLKDVKFPENCDNRDIQAGYDIITAYLKDCGENGRADLAADFSRIFLGAGIHDGNAAFPYESVYNGEKNLVMQQPWEEVRKIYAKHGLALETVPSEIMADHIAIELQFMALLCNGKDAIYDSKMFLKEHILSWSDRFCADIEKYAQTDFYKGVAAITRGFLHMDLELLDEFSEKQEENTYVLTDEEFDGILASISSNYKIYAPRLTGRAGRDGKEIVRFGEIRSISEIVCDRQSDFSAKEVYYPVMQTMIYFTEDESCESKLEDDKEILIIAHPCDINAIRRLDSIFLKNGGTEDSYYARLRNKVKFIMLECGEGFDNCFCVSSGSNIAEDYSAALRISNRGNYVLIKDLAIASAFAECTPHEYVPKFVTENRKSIVMPELNGPDDMRIARELEYWKEFDRKCIGCGGCNTVCPTCACFDTVDVIYDETSIAGERRRVWSSCMLDTFTLTAGGGRARKTSGENMRFKVLHKTYDYKKRFGKENMCVGCGRCTARCPEDIDFTEVVNGFADALKMAKKEAGKNE